MRHVILTCKNHPELRWSTKEISVGSNPQPGEAAHYNGARHIFFIGKPTGNGMHSDRSGLQCSTFVDGEIVQECSCPASDLIIANEDAEVTRG